MKIALLVVAIATIIFSGADASSLVPQDDDPSYVRGYLTGVSVGLDVGIRMGNLFGAAPYSQNATEMFNALVPQFNSGLAEVFGNTSLYDRYHLGYLTWNETTKTVDQIV